jgi:Fic family protein
MYFHQLPDWPNFNWDDRSLLSQLSQVRLEQGKLIGKMEGLGFSLREEASLKILTKDVVKSSLIEGEYLDKEEVRSSVAKRLGMDVAGLPGSGMEVDAVVEMMVDASQGYKNELTRDRLFTWHTELFQSAKKGSTQISVGGWREPGKGSMQVVSGAMGKEKVHFEAPESSKVGAEMGRFLEWFNENEEIDSLLKSGVAHLWFVTIHPFDDGNGRIARAIGDLLLCRADQSSQRFYSLSDQIEKTKKDYYDKLERTQKGSLDITQWLQWYLESVSAAIDSSGKSLEILFKVGRFWELHRATQFNVRQQRMIQTLQSDFFGSLSSSKWAKMQKCSQDTALRDIQDLVVKGILKKESGGGRSTTYKLMME